jgi:hypothetical protein
MDRGDLLSIAAMLVLVVGALAVLAHIFPQRWSKPGPDLGVDRTLRALGMPRSIARLLGWVLEAIASLVDAIA